MISAVRDRNIVDDSIRNIIDSMPNYVSKMVNIFIKYGKLINQKYVELAQSDERRRIKGVTSITALLSLTFDKLLFALDRDLYIDFLNEINSIEDSVTFYNYEGTRCNDDLEDAKRPGIYKISTINLVHPSTGIKSITGNLYDESLVPLVKINPEIYLNTDKNYKKDCCGGSFITFWNDDTNNYGIGVNFNNVEVEIDLCSLFEGMRTFMRYKGYKYNRYADKCDNSSDLHMLDFEDRIGELINDIIDHFTKTLTYSICTTYLAFLTKVNDTSISPIDMLFSNILNSCRKTVLDNYDSHGNDIKTGMGLRHMSIDISTILNSILYSSSKGDNNEFTILTKMIQYAISLQYVTYNYSLIPINNMKHKKLMNISVVAKSQVYLLNPDTRSSLQACVDMKTGNIAKYFCNKCDLKLDGTYSFNKRLYDSAKDFIDVFAKFIVIKKRMYDAGAFNVSDGTIDNIGKRYIDYKNYLKNTYDELKVSLSNIYTRIKNVTIGKRYLTNNFAVKNTDQESIRNLNTIVFGITSESVLDSSYCSNSIFDDVCRSKYKAGVDRNVNKYECPCDPNAVVQDIRHIYDVLKNRECGYSNNSVALLNAVNSYSNGSLITFWIAVNEACGNFFEVPFENLGNIIGSISMGYAESSINEMAPKQEMVDTFTSKVNISEWGSLDTSTYKSVEDLRESFEELKDQVEAHEGDNESIFGGLLFGDFGGVPLAHDMTAKETEIYNDQLRDRKSVV